MLEYNVICDVLQFIFSMVTARGSRFGVDGPKRPWLTEDETYEMITTHVTMAVMEVVQKMFVSIKTAMIELFDEHYAAITEVVVVEVTAAIAVVGL